MNPFNPLDARHVVIEYARVLERDISDNRHPARVDSLPYAKSIIKDAICTSTRHLAKSGQLTDELREYFETAYTLLAEYLDSELVELMIEYRQSAEAVGAGAVAPRDRTGTPAWQTLAQTSALAAEIARATTNEADALRKEFRNALTAV